MTPEADSVGSSSCSAITPPHSRWYCSARSRRPALATGLPSSVKPSAPSSRSSAISVSSSPASRRVIEARNPTGTWAVAAASSRRERSTGAESTVGSVLGIAITPAKPPAAAARVPDSRSSLCSWPGVRRWTWGSTKAGNRCRPAALIVAPSSGSGSVPGAPSSATVPSRTSTSWGSSRAVRGSSTWAPRMSRVAGGRAGATSRRLIPGPSPARARPRAAPRPWARAPSSTTSRRRPPARTARPCARPPRPRPGR